MIKGSCQLLFFLMLVACGSNNSNNKQYGTIIATDTPMALAAAGDSNTIKFDLLEAIFKNENWMLLNGSDTSFIYCSRLGKKYCKTYYYRMTNGDSTATAASEIKVSGNNIVWRSPLVGLTLILTNVAAGSAEWKDSNGITYTFQKADSSNMKLTGNSKHELQLKRTITLSSFLVMSKYDHKNGTRLAFENLQ